VTLRREEDELATLIVGVRVPLDESRSFEAFDRLCDRPRCEAQALGQRGLAQWTLPLEHLQHLRT
jgi:hypothetical protein